MVSEQREPSCQGEAAPPVLRLGDARIFIRGLVTNARLGAYPAERFASQPVRVDIEFGLRATRAFHSDRLEHAVDYAEVIRVVCSFLTSRHFDLVEALVHDLSLHLGQEFAIRTLDISITKLAAIPGVEVGVRLQSGSVPGASATEPSRPSSVESSRRRERVCQRN